MKITGGSHLPNSNAVTDNLIRKNVSEPALLPDRISTIHDNVAQGADLKFFCTTVSGHNFYVKSDSRQLPIRATEYLLYSLARHLEINVPDFAVLENDLGETFFGSKTVFSSASIIDAKYLMTRPSINELGQPTTIGKFCSRVHAFDLIFMNDDRAANNFLFTEDGMRKNMYAIDFADADVLAINHQQIFTSTSNTIRQKNIYQNYHGFDTELAIKLVDNLGEVEQSFIQRVLEEIPDDWMNSTTRKLLCEGWSNGNLAARVQTVRSYLTDGDRI